MVNYVNDSITSLNNTGSNLYVDSSASISNSTKISSIVDGSNVAVTVLPEYSIKNFSASNIAQQVLDKTNYDTVIVVVNGNKDSFGVASKMNETDIYIALNSSTSGNSGEILVNELGNIINLSTKEVTVSPDNSTPQNSNEGSFVSGGIFLGIAIALVVIVILGLRFVYNRVNKGQQPEKIEIKSASLGDKDIPEDLRKEYKEFLNNSSKLKTVKNKIDIGRTPFFINNIILNLHELFKRINRKGSTNQSNIAVIEYKNILEMINKTLSEDYYLDILSNPNLWTEPEKRVLEITNALQTVDNQLLENIRQVNSSKDLEFQVALQTLAKTIDNINPNEMLK